jgi:hypothetical protein
MQVTQRSTFMLAATAAMTSRVLFVFFPVQVMLIIGSFGSLTFFDMVVNCCLHQGLIPKAASVMIFTSLVLLLVLSKPIRKS